MPAVRSQGSRGVAKGYQPTPRAQGQRREFQLSEGDYQDLLQAKGVGADFPVWQAIAEREGFHVLTVRWEGPHTRSYTAKET